MVAKVALSSLEMSTDCELLDHLQEGDAKKTLAPEYIENQKAVDAALTSGLDATVKSYLGSRFTLKSGDRPHLMKF